MGRTILNRSVLPKLLGLLLLVGCVCSISVAANRETETVKPLVSIEEAKRFYSVSDRCPAGISANEKELFRKIELMKFQKAGKTKKLKNKMALFDILFSILEVEKGDISLKPKSKTKKEKKKSDHSLIALSEHLKRSESKGNIEYLDRCPDIPYAEAVKAAYLSRWIYDAVEGKSKVELEREFKHKSISPDIVKQCGGGDDPEVFTVESIIKNTCDVPFVDTSVTPVVVLSSPEAIYVVVRGSSSAMDWIYDFLFTQEKFEFKNLFPEAIKDKILSGSEADLLSGYYIHHGFLRAHKMNTGRELLGDLLNLYVRDKQSQESRGVDPDDFKFKPIHFIGHSLGGALAEILSLEWAMAVKFFWNSDFFNNKVTAPKLFTFGAPRVGNRKFAKAKNDLVEHYRFVHRNDLVPWLPSSEIGQAILAALRSRVGEAAVPIAAAARSAASAAGGAAMSRIPERFTRFAGSAFQSIIGESKKQFFKELVNSELAELFMQMAMVSVESLKESLSPGFMHMARATAHINEEESVYRCFTDAEGQFDIFSFIRSIPSVLSRMKAQLYEDHFMAGYIEAMQHNCPRTP